MTHVYAMRRMRRSELDPVVQWAAAEGWNPGLHDAEAFFAADPEGFFVGTLDGDVIASISVVTYSPGHAFLGLYIVHPEHRGRGYGLRLWRYALDHTSATTVGLDGVVAQIPAYERSGFTLSYRSIRYVTQAERREPPAGIRPIGSADLPAVEHYDRRVFGVSRAVFLAAWLRQPGVRTAMADDAGRVTGFGAIRPARHGYRIGPLFADSQPVAERLFDALLAAVRPGTDVAIDVPGANPQAMQLAAARGMSAEFETARMYLGTAPSVPVGQIYGVTSFELG
ncbi:MAG: family acetyltransferase [Microbacterium sp.]|nr:family acetyltransferase [Microbacterium sp.]